MEDNKQPVAKEHQLWVNLSSLGEGNVFALLPQMLKKMVAEIECKQEWTQFFKVTLPSDFDWRTTVYFRMLDKKKKILEAR